MRKRSTGSESLSGQLEDNRTYKVCVISFFDGVLEHHKSLLTYGSGLCADHRGELLVVVCNLNQLVCDNQTTTASLLTGEERVDMIKSKGYHHTILCQLPPVQNTESNKQWKACQETLLRLSEIVVPGADLWHNKHFFNLQKPGEVRHKHLYEKIDHQFKQTSTNQHLEMLQLLEQGRVEKMFSALGYAFPVSGYVVEGNKIGRTLGYPTANLRIDDHNKAVPGQGVYTGLVNVAGKWYPSMINIGIRPTLDMEKVTIEAHLFHFEGNIYGERVSIGFLKRIRDEMRFNSLSELKQQLHRDRDVATASLIQQMNNVHTNAFVFAGIKSS
ncbi:MAG: hypothetical protein EA394_06545 [Bacteroidia bacterium]|nr:MAG: hypothetical protein EA394_06545 [Bacteroidia bacterium]